MQEDTLLNELLTEEDYEQFAYKDSRGFTTIAIGRCIDKRAGKGISFPEAMWLLGNDAADVSPAEVTKRYPFAASLNVPRMNVLRQMAFTMGWDGLAKFTSFLRNVALADYAAAGRDLIASLWHSECPERVFRLSNQMRTGESQYPKKEQPGYTPSDIH